MDDDATELAELRRRAYGPDADIAADPAALARLRELEDGDRDRSRAGRVVPNPPDTDVGIEPARHDTAGSAAEDEAVPVPVPVPARRRRRARWHGALVLGVAAVAVCLAAVAAEMPVVVPPTVAATVPPPDPLGVASPFGTDPAARVLLQVPTDGILGEYLGPPPTGPPSFPVPEDLLWTSPLGNYYGWSLWLARSRSGFPCVALVREGQDTRSRCVLPARYDEGALVVTIPYAQIAPADRPEGMQPRESLGFEWLTDSTVSVVVGRARGLAAP